MLSFIYNPERFKAAFLTAGNISVSPPPDAASLAAAALLQWVNEAGASSMAAGYTPHNGLFLEETVRQQSAEENVAASTSRGKRGPGHHKGRLFKSLST